MWDTVLETTEQPTRGRRLLSHDLPCLSCGHATHTFLRCDDRCDCAPVALPGTA